MPGSQPAATIGVDVGGTFTDAAVTLDGRRLMGKVPTTPEDQSLGVIAAIAAALAGAGSDRPAVDRLAHGTTVGTNALLEGRVARTALCVTRGFRDLLALRRQDRAHLYRLEIDHPAPVVDAADVVEVEERCGPEGVLVALTEDEAARVADAVAALGVEAVAVGLLFSFAHPEHERRLARALRERLPGAHVSASVDVLPEIREYERISTTAVDAALGPVLRGYLSRLAGRAAAAGLPAPEIMQSSGGLIDLAAAAEHPAWTVLSGPAAGVMGAAAVAAAAGVGDVLTLDMGGTSCDVAAVLGGGPGRRADTVIGGQAVALPVLDVETVSAGGGSIAWRDTGGALRVGPRSAGARPGPAAYGLGGTEPTVTDADVVLGRIPGDELEGGVRIDRALAGRAVDRLAASLGLDRASCAEGILAVACEEMARALRLVSVERGVDPRTMTLVAFGGAGPLHACQVAEALGVQRVLVPREAGVLAALGLITAPERRDAVRSVLLPADDPALAGVVAEIAGGLAERLPGGRVAVAADCRARGQRHHLTVDWPGAPDPARLMAAFHAAHRRRFGDVDEARPVEVVSVRASAERGGAALVEETDREEEIGGGPLVVALRGATCWVPEGWRARRDAGGRMLLERAP